MPVSWEIRSSILIVTLVGECGVDITKAFDEAMADPRFRAGTSLLLDVRRSADNPSSEEFRRRTELLARRTARGLATRVAILIGPKPHQYGLARMASVHSETNGIELEIFTEMDEALEWLERAGESAATVQ